MANTEHERNEMVEYIIARYVEEYRAGKQPSLAEYARRYPQYAVELTEFAVDAYVFGLEEFVESAPDPTSAPQLSPAAQQAMARIRQQYVDQYALDGLVKQGKRVNLTLRQLAQKVTLTTDVILKLEAQVIEVASIPRTLIRRLAEALQVAPEAVALYLGGSRATTTQPGFYYATEAPTQTQESFLDAIQESSQLSAESKAEWRRIIQDEIA